LPLGVVLKVFEEYTDVMCLPGAECQCCVIRGSVFFQAAAPSVLQNCVPAYKSQAVPAVKNSTQFYNVFITIPDCFYGLVRLSAYPLMHNIFIYTLMHNIFIYIFAIQGLIQEIEDAVHPRFWLKCCFHMCR
jgi:hypothetical protein